MPNLQNNFNSPIFLQKYIYINENKLKKKYKNKYKKIK